MWAGSRVDRLIDAVADPASVALGDHSASATYEELVREAEALAFTLRQHGVGHGDRVAIRTEKSIGTIGAMLGVLRSGACYVAVSPSNPPQRRDFLVRDSGAKVFLMPNGNGAGLSPFDCTMFLTKTGATIAHAGGGSAPTMESSGKRSDEDPAYVLYTSGSTGRPKGVVMSHRGAFAFSRWAAQRVGLGPGDNVLNVTTFDFDLSIFDIFATQLAGARLHVAEDTVPRAPKKLLETIEAQEITVLYTVPWTLVMLLESGEDVARQCASLCTVIFAGEVFPIDHLKRLTALLPHVHFYNFYGPTETNVCSCYALPRSLPEETTEIPIGRPASEAQLSILDEDGAPVVDGEIGELHVDGPTVMNGYLNDDRICLVTRPYGTGDLALRRSDGEIMYRGRRDTQVKVRGHRIDLLEVERVLDDHPAVRECAVAVVSKALHAFVCADEETSTLAIRQHTAGALPAYMVPTSVHFIASLPRHDNLKVNRKALEILGSRPANTAFAERRE